MRKLYYISIMLFLSVLLHSQTVSLDSEPIEIYDSTVFKQSKKPLEKKKVKFGLSAGMSYMFSSNGVNGPSFSLSPHATYPVSDRFSLTAGVSAMSSSYMVPYYNSNGEMATQFLPMTQLYMYASGNYKVNEKLEVSGSVYKAIIDVPNNTPENQNSSKANYDYSGVSIGFTYKITPNISVGAQIKVTDSPYYQNGLSPYNSPYYNPYRAGGNYPVGW